MKLFTRNIKDTLFGDTAGATAMKTTGRNCGNASHDVLPCVYIQYVQSYGIK